jgi:twitching motility protein PilT
MFPAGEKEQIRSQLAESLLWVVWQKLLKKSDWEWRVVASEVLLNNVWISNIIRKLETHKIDSIIETSKSEWMVQMKDSLSNLFKKWLISKENYEMELSYLK